MEKVYSIGIKKMSNSFYKIYKGGVTVKFGLSGTEEVICWLPLNIVGDTDFEHYYYFIDEEGDLSRKLKSL
jgi:hypothetical protein